MNTKKAAITVLSITWRIVITALIAMALVRLGEEAYHYGHSVFHTQPIDPEPGRQVAVSIEDGADVAGIGKLLEKKGLIEDWKLFYIQVRLSKYSKTLKSGEYTLTTAMAPKDMMIVMSGENLEEEEDEEKKDGEESEEEDREEKQEDGENPGDGGEEET